MIIISFTVFIMYLYCSQPVISCRGGSGGRLNRRYSNEDLTFDLPSGTDMCDIATFTVWCEAASAFFTRIEIPRSTFVSSLSDS